MLIGPCSVVPPLVAPWTMQSSELWTGVVKLFSKKGCLCTITAESDYYMQKKTKAENDFLTFLRNSSATIRALALTDNFISLISLSISSMKWMTKSTSLCLYICSVWKLVIKKLISYPWNHSVKQWTGKSQTPVNNGNIDQSVSPYMLSNIKTFTEHKKTFG